jgi:hypothetical protein
MTSIRANLGPRELRPARARQPCGCSWPWCASYAARRSRADLTSLAGGAPIANRHSASPPYPRPCLPPRPPSPSSPPAPRTRTRPRVYSSPVCPRVRCYVLNGTPSTFAACSTRARELAISADWCPCAPEYVVTYPVRHGLRVGWIRGATGGWTHRTGVRCSPTATELMTESLRLPSAGRHS